MTDTVFTQQTPADPSTVQTPTLPPEVVEFVGSGKKYADVNVALQSIPHAQKHISTLESELAATKAELEKRRTAEELVEEFRKSGGAQPAIAAAPTNPLNPDVVVQLIQQTLENRESESKAKVNINAVTEAFFLAHGKEHAEQKYIELALASGMSVDTLNRLAAQAPSAVLKLAGLDKAPAPAPARLASGVNTEGFSQKPQELSARVGRATTTKDMVQAWRNAGEKVKQTA